MKLLKTFLSAALLFAAAALPSSLLAQTKQYYATVELQNQDTILYIRSYEQKPSVDQETILFVLDGELSTATLAKETSINSYPNKSNIRRAVLDIDETFKPQSTAFWFYNLDKLETIYGLEKLNTEEVTTMEAMFYRCISLEYLNLSNFQTQNVTTMYEMFCFCGGLKTLDLSSFYTEKLTSTSRMMFSCSNLDYVDLGNFDTKEVTDMDNMFSANILKYIFCNSDANLSIDKLTKKSQYVFPACSTLVGVKKDGTEVKLTKPDYTISNNAQIGASKFKKADENGYITEKTYEYIELVAPENLTCACGEDLDLSDGYIKKTVTFGNNQECEINVCSLKELASTIKDFDNTKLGTQTVSVMYGDMELTFDVEVLSTEGYYATVEEEGEDYVLYIKHHEQRPKAEGSIKYVRTDMLETLDINDDLIADYDLLKKITRAVLEVDEDFKPISTAFWFSNLENLKKIEGLEKLNTEEVTRTWGMFHSCSSLTSLNISNFKTDALFDMRSMFFQCPFETLDLSDFKINARDYAYSEFMFAAGKNLKAIDLGNLNTQILLSINNMFEDCSSLLYIFCDSDMILNEDMQKNENNYKDCFKNCSTLVGVTTDGSKEQWTSEKIGITGFAYAENGGYFTKKTGETIKVVGLKKLKYKIGEELELAGGKILKTVQFGNNETFDFEFPLEDLAYSLKGYDSTQLGTQKLSVNYLGKEVSFEVEVVEDVAVEDLNASGFGSSAFEAWAGGGVLRVSVERAGVLEVLSVNGVLLRRDVVAAGALLNLPLEKGVYVLRLGGEVKKVVVE